MVDSFWNWTTARPSGKPNSQCQTAATITKYYPSKSHTICQIAFRNKDLREVCFRFSESIRKLGKGPGSGKKGPLSFDSRAMVLAPGPKSDVSGPQFPITPAFSRKHSELLVRSQTLIHSWILVLSILVVHSASLVLSYGLIHFSVLVLFLGMVHSLHTVLSLDMIHSAYLVLSCSLIHSA